MPRTNTVHVVIPFYSNTTYLMKAIDSVLMQNYQEFTLLIVDDFSPHTNISNLVARFNDPRIEYIRNSSNLGLAKNFQNCLNLVTSDWFVMLGEDDILLPNYLSEMLTVANSQKDCAVIQPLVQIIDENGLVVIPRADKVKFRLIQFMKFINSSEGTKGAKVSVLTGSQVLPWLLLGNFFYFPTILWNTKIAKQIGFSEEYPITLDLKLLLTLTKSDKNFAFCDSVLAKYRRHEESVSNNPRNLLSRLREERNLSHDFLRNVKLPGAIRLLAILRLTSRLHAVALAAESLKQRKIISARKFLQEAFRY